MKKRKGWILSGLLLFFAQIIFCQDFAMQSIDVLDGRSSVNTQEILADPGTFSYQELIKHANILSGKGNNQSALEVYKQAKKLNPKAALTYDKCGQVYIELKEYRKAIFNLSKAIRLEPGFIEAYNHRGIANFYNHNFYTSIEDYTRAIELDSTYAKAYYNRAICYIQLSHKELAYRDLKKALRMNYPGAEQLIWDYCTDQLFKVPKPR